MYIVVRVKSDRVKEVARYLYEGQTLLPEMGITSYGNTLLLVDTGTNDRYRSEYLRDRLVSGMFGATLFASHNEAKHYIETEVRDVTV